MKSKNFKESINRIYEIHDIDCNQMYNEFSYSYHLTMVVDMAEKFITEINDKTLNKHKEAILVAAAGHDLIEDARYTYNDIVDLFGKRVADIVYACTEEKGKTRDDRHSEKFYNELSENRLAVFVKLCDMFSNIIFSQQTNSSMWSKYKKSYPSVKQYLYKQGEYDILWQSIEDVLNTK